MVNKNFSTKSDFLELRHEIVILRKEMVNLADKITIRLSGVAVIVAGLMLAVLKH